MLSLMKRHPWLTAAVAAVAWYYSWSFYVAALPHSSAYFDRTRNPIPDACGETVLSSPDGHFAEVAFFGVAKRFDEVRPAAETAVRSRFGVKYSGPESFGRPPLGESLSAEIVGEPYSRSPDLGRWKAKGGSSFLLVSVVSARTLGHPSATVVAISRVDHWRSWASREFHTGIQFPFPARVDNFRRLVTSSELDFIKATLGPTCVGPAVASSSSDAWRNTDKVRVLVEQAAGRRE